MFRSKKNDKENDVPVEDDRKPIGRSGSAYNSTRKDRRSSVAIGFEDTFAKPTASYHTVTQPKQAKGTRSCIGRDEYERSGQFCPQVFKDSAPSKNGSKYGKRRFYESKLDDEFSTLKSANYDEELLDSDDSFASEDEKGRIHYRDNEVVRDLKDEVKYLRFQLRHEVIRKQQYKEKLFSERRNVQKLMKQCQGMEYDINIYKSLLANLKNERKAQHAKIAKLDSQLKTTKSRFAEICSFGGATYTTPTSTSNEPSSMDEAVIDIDGAGEMLCSASESTLAVQNAFASRADSIDEVKNFRKDDTNSSLELARAEAEVGIERLDLDSTLLIETETEQLSVVNERTPRESADRKKLGLRVPSTFRRSLSDSDLRSKRCSVAFKMTNL